MQANRINRLSKIEDQFAFGSGEYKSSVIGFVCPKSKSLTATYHLVGGKWTPTIKEPNAFFPEIVKPMFLNPKRFMALIGGRGSGKTIVKGDHGHTKFKGYGT